MAQKNQERRDSILAISYQLFGDTSYQATSLSDIAKRAGISKSLLQHYFSQKIDIVKTMVTEFLNTSSAYMETLGYEDEEIFQGISDFDMLYFKAVTANYRLYRFMLCSVEDPSCLDVWVETICTWLRKYYSEDTFTYRQLKTALCFSMGGTMHLFLHQDELDINYRRYCRIHIESILRLLGYKTEKIESILALTDARIEQIDAEDLLAYCSKNIAWLVL